VNFVRGRAEAHWLPSRHNFAVFRLAAYLRLRNAKPETRDEILFIDRHQSATETWAVGLWLVVTLSCYLATSWFPSWPLPLALAASFPLAWIGVQVVAVATGIILTLVMRTDVHLTVNSFLCMLLFTSAAAWYATRPTWVRIVAWQFLAILVVNAIAAMIVFLLRGPIARLEASVSAQ
jgi:hypothetical protein